jgi:hypothetical protein
MNVSASAAAAQIALQTIAQQNAQQPTQLAAAVNAPQTDALALTQAESAATTAPGTTGTVGTNVNTYA